MKVILASQSPRRRELLKELISDFEIMAQNVDEVSTQRRPAKRAVELALLKLGSLPSLYADALAVSADTLVYRAGKFYGKPRDNEDARRILRELSGKKHYVYTGVAVYFKGRICTFADKSSVRFKTLSDDEIDAYIATGSPMDKAGAYGIQDKQAVVSYKGSYSNIVGLPVEKLKKLLNRLFGAQERI